MIKHTNARAWVTLPYDVGPARVFLGEAEKTPMCGLGPASRVKGNMTSKV